MSSPLLAVFRNQIIPWSEQFGVSPIAVAVPSWKALQAGPNLPRGVRAEHVAWRSKRTPVKGRRQYGNAALIDAYWPEDHLQSSRAPMLQYVLSGRVRAPLGDYAVLCAPGHGILIPAGVAHSDGSHLMLDESVPGNTACQLLMMRPYNGGMECWLSHTKDGAHWSHRLLEESCRIPSMQAAFYLETLAEEAVARKMRSRELCDALLTALINVLFRELHQTASLLPAPTENSEALFAQANANPMMLAKDFIRSHLGESLTLNRVARHVYMSERSFSHQFRQATGQSFMQYLTECRFQEAAHLLTSTDWSIEQIAHFVGLKTGRLRMLFHQRTGKSPRLYRQMQQMRNNDD